MSYFDMVQHSHWDGGDHHDLLFVILEYKYHVEVLQLKLDTLKVHQLDILQSDDHWWLQ
jgi:hypothetical protein